MARADEIRRNAAATLKVYLADEKYLWCAAHVLELTAKELKRSFIENIIGYVTGLQSAIAEDDLVTMRRHEHPERYSESFERGVKEINKILSARAEPQLSLFSQANAEQSPWMQPQADDNFSYNEDESKPDYDNEGQEISM